MEQNGTSPGTLHFGDRVIHAYRHTLGKVCRQVMVKENYIVPARHEANVPVKLSDKDIPHPTDNWVIETKQLSTRVMTVRTLINGNQERLVARVCNYSDEPYKLKGDYYLACAEPVECIPGPGEKLSGELRDSNSSNVLSMPMSTGATASTDLLLTAERDPATALRLTTVGKHDGRRRRTGYDSCDGNGSVNG